MLTMIAVIWLCLFALLAWWVVFGRAAWRSDITRLSDDELAYQADLAAGFCESENPYHDEISRRFMLEQARAGAAAVCSTPRPEQG
ncbi:hypothetical protein KY495_10865 [Massilia sp. PAMC28688]|uniref:hypothetical protein n=1 Tax=Massilia sp. PAMC28688 TaxID=2861283 RepID=UPI001C626EC3|nr:hypothetical protein [Massilia sp. PAMC28688]QYF95600.1 hypothetical protein KY495_10865 [Massilia sp. PAMC28688]